MSKFAVFHFHTDMKGLGLNENSILTDLHYRTDGTKTPPELGIGSSLSLTKAKGKQDFRSPTRKYSQTWMNKFFIIANLDVGNWLSQLSHFSPYWGEKHKIIDEIIDCMASWEAMAIGTRLYLPNPYYQFIETAKDRLNWFIGEAKRKDTIGIDNFGLMYLHTFLSRMWIPVGDHDSTIDSNIGNPAEGFNNYWSPSFIYANKKPKDTRALDMMKIGLGGFGLIERGLESIARNPLDGTYGLLSPRYLVDSQHPRLLKPVDFMDLEHLKAHGGAQIQQSKSASNDRHRFNLPTNKLESSIIYDGYFTIDSDVIESITPNNPSKGFRSHLLESQGIHKLDYGNTNTTMELDPTRKVITEWNTIKPVNIHKSNQNQLPEPMIQWLTQNQAWFSSPMPLEKLADTSEHSKVYEKPLIFGRNDTILNDKNRPTYVPQQQSTNETFTLRTRYHSGFWSLIK